MRDDLSKIEVIFESTEGRSRQLYKPIEKSSEVELLEMQFEWLQHANYRFFCQECQLDVTRQAHAITSEKGLYFYYCVVCLMELQNYPEEYLIKSGNSKSLNGSSWDMNDEVLLMDGLMRFGFGNWSQIKEYLDYNQAIFSISAIETHYEEMYVIQPDCLIKITLPTATAKPKDTIQQLMLDAYIHTKHKMLSQTVSDKQKQLQYKLPDRQSSNHEDCSSPSELKIESRVAAMPRIEGESQESTVVGYNSRRKEFQLTEYDYSAEVMLADLEFYDSDAEEEIQLKLDIIAAYNRRLDERLVRRQFVVENKFLDSQYQFHEKQKLNSDSHRRMQPFMRFSDSHKQYMTMVDYYRLYSLQEQHIRAMMHMRVKVSKRILPNFLFLKRKRIQIMQKWQQETNSRLKNSQPRKIFHLDPYSKRFQSQTNPENSNEPEYFELANSQLDLIEKTWKQHQCNFKYRNFKISAFRTKEDE